MNKSVGNTSIRSLVKAMLPNKVLSSKFLGEVTILVQHRILKSALNGAEPTMANWPHKSHYASWYWEKELCTEGIIEHSLTARSHVTPKSAKSTARLAYAEADRIAAELIDELGLHDLLKVINNPPKRGLKI